MRCVVFGSSRAGGWPRPMHNVSDNAHKLLSIPADEDWVLQGRFDPQRAGRAKPDY